MNINEAKKEISNAIIAYLSKDEFGAYKIPVSRQRPVFLIGPPGIGKTEIMRQIAQENGIGLVAYSMTHHTRQSALGLPFITQKTYGGKSFSVSEYTMSEIIASVYDTIEKSGFKEGILFLDEINCVSETLAAPMLQFLQNKEFGRHKVPDGWVVVTAGNPPTYNNSVREFDAVTWDRLKKIDVEASFDVWRTYAVSTNVHPSVISYLDVHENDFYHVEATVDGQLIVTARAWTDLSEMIWLYEENKLEVNGALIEQYIQNPRTARDFAVFYDLYTKYQSTYQIDDILAGKADETIKERARKAKKDKEFGECYSLITMLYSVINTNVQSFINIRDSLSAYAARSYTVKGQTAIGNMSAGGVDIRESIQAELDDIRSEYEKREAASAASEKDKYIFHYLTAAFEKVLREIELAQSDDVKDAFLIMTADYKERKTLIVEKGQLILEMVKNAIIFIGEVFGDKGREMNIFISDLSLTKSTGEFLGLYKCPVYVAHCGDMMLDRRQGELSQLIDELLNFE